MYDEIIAWFDRHVQHTEGRRLDANETAILAQQLEAVEAQTYDIKYAQLEARRFVPGGSAPNGAETVAYYQWDHYGMAAVISNYATDLPRVDATAQKFTQQCKSLGASYGYSIQDLRAALQSGQPLDAHRATAARRAMEAGLDRVIAFGIPEAGMAGFLNHPNIPLVSPVTGTWSGATALQILEDMNTLVRSIVSTTLNVHKPTTLLMDSTSFGIVADTPMSTDNTTTILQTFLRNNPYIREVDQWHQLDTADAAGTGPRLMCYERASEVCEHKLAQDYETFPAQARGLEFLIPAHMRTGGVVVRYPLAAAYMDGI